MESMESFEISKINLRFSPWHKNTNDISMDTSESEDDSSKISKLATPYT